MTRPHKNASPGRADQEILKRLAERPAFKVRGSYRRPGDASAIQVKTIARLVRAGLVERTLIKNQPAAVLSPRGRARAGERKPTERYWWQE